MLMSPLKAQKLHKYLDEHNTTVDSTAYKFMSYQCMVLLYSYFSCEEFIQVGSLGFVGS